MRRRATLVGLLLLAASSPALAQIQGTPEGVFCVLGDGWRADCKGESECKRAADRHMCEKHGQCSSGQSSSSGPKVPYAAAMTFVAAGGLAGYLIGDSMVDETGTKIPGVASAGAQAGAGSMLLLSAIGTAPRAHPVETIVYATAGGALAARGVAELQNRKEGKSYDVNKSTVIGGAVGALTGFVLAPLSSSSGSKLRLLPRRERSWAPILNVTTWGMSVRW